MLKSLFIREKKADNGKRTTTMKIFTSIITILLIFITFIKINISPISKVNIIQKSVTIPIGSNIESIAGILKENDLIKNEIIFKLYSRIEDRGSKYKAGDYELNTGMSQGEIIDQLEKGGKLKGSLTFTIPEGFELKQIAERLESVGLTDKNRFISIASNVEEFKDEYKFLKDLPQNSTLEGYLYPNTYEVFKDATEEDIIKKMLDGFNKVYTDEIETKGKDLGMDTNKIITMASIIEREAVIEKERSIMSGVFQNRLKIDMPLQSCATVQYALGERKQVLSNKDVQIESNYNTYINSGLPPSPISSPGIKSIKAAVNPEKVDYLFFVRTGEDGSHTFTTTYNEHLKAKNIE